MNFSIKKIELASLQKEFGTVNFRYFETDNTGFMGCISASFENSEEVIKLWSAVQSMAAAYLKPQSNYSKWNLYFAIFCAGKLPLSHKYKIQNDKFAMRKIIFDGFDKLPNESEMQCVLNRAILGADLEVKELAVDQIQELPDFSLVRIINGLPLDMTVVSKEARQNAIFEIINNHLK